MQSSNAKENVVGEAILNDIDAYHRKPMDWDRFNNKNNNSITLLQSPNAKENVVGEVILNDIDAYKRFKWVKPNLLGLYVGLEGEYDGDVGE